MSGWLLPAALLGLSAGFWLTRRAPRTDPRRASLVLWGGWLLVTAGVLSFAGGIIHSYYTVALAPAAAAGAGMVLPALWRSRAQWRARLALTLIGATTAVVGYLLLGRASDWLPWLRWSVLIAGLTTSAALLFLGAARFAGPGRRIPALAAGLAGLALVSGLAAPAAWSLATVGSTHTGSIPTAGPAQAATAVAWFGRDARPGQGRPGMGGQVPGMGGQVPGMGGQVPGGVPGDAETRVAAELVALLRNAGTGYTWSAATSSSMIAGPLALASNTAVMSLGGFGGQDPAITLAQFKAYVAAHKVRYYVTGGAGLRGPGGPAVAGDVDGAQGIESWVSTAFRSQTVGGSTVYDLSAATSSAP
jgi:4-amino-4-deoxy-L-arabinose transferase-like glycosyltransferase